ncbi:hypothetical protein KAJ27_11365 [bacterium]|nr:hypothetical protein [bacterium]
MARIFAGKAIPKNFVLKPSEFYPFMQYSYTKFTKSGSYNMTVKVDASNQISEKNEANNTQELSLVAE